MVRASVPHGGTVGVISKQPRGDAHLLGIGSLEAVGGCSAFNFRFSSGVPGVPSLSGVNKWVLLVLGLVLLLCMSLFRLWD